MRTRHAATAPAPGPGLQTPASPDGKDTAFSAVRPTAPDAAGRLHSTRASRAWARVLPVLVLLGVILLFIFQNLHKARVSFVTASGTLPLGLALLAAAAFGGLFVLALGSARIFQLRKVIRHNQTAHTGTNARAPR